MKHIKRIISLVLAIASLLSICTLVLPVHASETTTTLSNSITAITVNSSDLYEVTNKTALRSEPSNKYTTHATLQKGTLVEGIGCSNNGKYIMVSVSDKTWWVKLSDLKKASRSTEASIYYCADNVVLRTGPYEKSSKIKNLSKGTMLAVVGKVKNSHDNTWLVVYRSDTNTLAYVYDSEKVKSAKKVTMKVSGVNSISVGEGTLSLSAKVDPSVIKDITWSSSDPKIATVSNGKVTPKLAGNCTITATISNAVKVNFPITVTYQWPTSGKVTSEFGWRTLRGKRDLHGGIDIGAKKGTPIKAVADGKVTKAMNSGGYGNLVIITHEDGSKTYYAHCSKLLVSKNQKVSAGQVIAEVGSTGNSTGNHLHFEIRIDDERVEPRLYLE